MSDAITPNPKPAEAVKLAPAAPAKAAAVAPAEPGEDRRFFLFTVMGIALGALLAAAGYLIFRRLPNTPQPFPPPFKAGYPDDYEDGKVVERFKDRYTWIVRDGGIIYALSTTCTHLGCTPNWLEREQKFKCPCHGSGYYIDGVNFEGPAPRPLERWGIRIGDDGQIVVDRTMKFQKELGQWESPDSFIRV